MATKKASNKKAEINFTDSKKAIQTAAKTINTKVKNATTEVVGDLKENSQLIVGTATKSIKSTYSNVAEMVTVENITSTTKVINEFAVSRADQIVEDVYVSSEKWQKVGDKAVKGSLKLAGKQQEIMFDAMETVKQQLVSAGSSIVKVFSKN